MFLETLLAAFLFKSDPHCLPLSLMHRTGTESCWVKTQLNSKTTVCIPHPVWNLWLRSKTPIPICIPESPRSSNQKWRAYTFNQPTGNITSKRVKTPSSTYSPSITKKPRYTITLNTHSSYPNPTPHLTLLSRMKLKLLHRTERLRERISLLLSNGHRDQAESTKPSSPDLTGALRSIILHENPNPNLASMFRRLGFVHLLSSSGIHLYACMRTWNWILRSLTQAAGLPVPVGLWISRITSHALCVILWILAGARLGMLRPWAIILLREGSKTLGFRWKKGSPLILALVLDILWDWRRDSATETMRESFREAPSLNNALGSSGRQQGRWIYALAVGGGLFWYPCIKLIPRFKLLSKSVAHSIASHLDTHLGLAIGSWIAVAILEISHSGLVSLATPLISLITLPMMCLIAYPFVLLCIALYELGYVTHPHSLLQLGGQAIHHTLSALTQLSLLPGNLWVVNSSALLPAAGIAMALLCTTNWRYHRALCITSLLLLLGGRLLAPQITAQFSGVARTQIHQLDVGQGDAALISETRPTCTQTKRSATPISRRQVGLIDTGSFHALSDDQWIQLFARTDTHRLDWIALSHLDEDHSGGLKRLSRLIRIGCVVAPTAELESKRGRKFQKKLLRAGVRIRPWSFLENSLGNSLGSSPCIPYPSLEIGPTSLVQGQKLRPNESMGIVLVPLTETKLEKGFYLSTGDLTEKGELELSKWLKSKIHPKTLADQTIPKILKVSHHGSRTSTGIPFLQVIKPTEAWISVGTGNRYGHPSIQTLQRLLDFKIPVKRTDRDGSLSIVGPTK